MRIEMTAHQVEQIFMGSSGTIYRTEDCALISKMIDWPEPVFIHPDGHYLIIDGLVLLAFFPYLDGLQLISGFSLDGRGEWIVETVSRAINWAFANTEAQAVYAGAADFREGDRRIMEKAGMRFSHEDEREGMVVKFYKIEKSAYLTCLALKEIENIFAF